MRHLLSVQDLQTDEINTMLRDAAAFKAMPRRPILKGKVMAMIFQKPSTRTRVSFEVAMEHLGGRSIFLSSDDLQLSRGETIGDTARALSRYVDCIMARVNSHKELEELAGASSVPVINGLSDLLHPCQALSDVFTIKERLPRLEGLRLAFLGDGSSNVCHSLLLLCPRLGIGMSVACPKSRSPDKAILKKAMENAKASGSSIEVVRDPKRASKSADVLYTDTWQSMGKAKSPSLRKYQLNSALLRTAAPHAFAMHCLPAHRGKEITSEVMDGPRSAVWDQAENRLHMQKAILSFLL
jgi:ornithine carbamoyltransferase